MIRKYLQQAFDYGHDVIVQFNYCCNARYMGKITDLDDKSFCLLHLGEANTMNWVFKIDDIKYMGVYKENALPSYESNPVSEIKRKDM